jgi:molecular chaperone GrpE
MPPDRPNPAAQAGAVPPPPPGQEQAPLSNPLSGDADSGGIKITGQSRPAPDAQTPPAPPAPEAAAPAPEAAAPATSASETVAAPVEEQPLLTPAEQNVDLTIKLIEAEGRIAEAEAQAAEQRDAWLRAKAETENVRRRAQEEVAKTAKFASEKFAGTMLPVKDALEAALAIENQTLEKLREGVELTLKQLVAAFESAGLREENPLGQKFDPNKHQAIGALESDAEPNTVIDVLQKGYLLHERVIRPAMVMVARAKA